MSGPASVMPWMLTPDAVRNSWEEFARKMVRLPAALQVARKTRVGATPADVVRHLDKIRLKRYLPGDVPQRFSTPLLFVFALVNRPYILDLRKGKSVVEHFVNRGFDCYNIDWGAPSQADRYLGMRDYIERYLDEMVDHVRERTGCDRINLLGYCMGGTLSAVYAALHPEKVRNLILLAAPVDWSDRENLLSRWTDVSVFDVDRLVSVLGNAPPEMLQTSFLMLKPVSNLVEKYVTFFENLDNEKFLEDFFAMETWLNDNIPVAGEMFREFVKHCMQENRLIEGRLEVAGRQVDLRDITMPVLNLMAEQDHLVPCGQSRTFNDAVGSRDRSAIIFPAGHIGMAVGSRANRELWPKVADWLAQRSEIEPRAQARGRRVTSSQRRRAESSAKPRRRRPRDGR